MEAITISTNYLWAVLSKNGRDNNIVYCRWPCSDASSWIDAMGMLNQNLMIDVNEENMSMHIIKFTLGQLMVVETGYKFQG